MQFIKEILVIEDNQLDFILLKEYLSMTESEITTISNWKLLQETVEKANDSKPELIFLDLNLPDSNGLETFLSVNNLFPFTPIIVLSGMQDTEMALQAIQAGAQDYLIKGDFDPKVLSKIIQYSIERKRNQIKLQESNRLYEMVSKATDDPLWDWDLITNDIQWNDKVNIFGYPLSVKKNDAWWCANVHPEDFSGVEERMQTCFLNNQTDHWSDSYRFMCFDGSYKYILDRGYIIRDKTGKAIRMIGAMQDITDQVHLQQKLDEERAAQQKAILQATMEGQEKERSEIGKELHDNINQVLASVKLMIESVMSQLPGENKLLSESVQLTDLCIKEIRSLSSALVPIKEQEMSLADAIKVIANRIRTTSGLQFSLSISDALVEKLNDRQQLTIYRILQEQTTNIIKHAGAVKVTIRLFEENNMATLVVSDDGKGFDMSKRADGIGLRNMKSRCELLNGTFLIESEPGKGCKTTVAIPL